MKKILLVGTHSAGLKERITNMLKDRFSLSFAETTKNGRDAIAEKAIDIGITLINISSLLKTEGMDTAETIKVVDYIGDISFLMRDSLESNIPVIVTCSESGNPLAQILDRIISNENVLVTGKIAPEDIAVLIEKSLSTTSFKDATIADLEKKEDSDKEAASSTA